MNRAVAAVAVCASIACLATGCVDQTRAANDAIARANAKAKEYRSIDAEVTRLLDDASSVDFTPEGVRPAIPQLEQARKKVVERQQVVAAVRAAFASIAGLRVSGEVKAYATQQVAIADLLAEADAQALVLIDATKEFYERIMAGDAAGAQAQALAERILKASQEIKRLSETISKKRAEADAYFEEHLSPGR
ncbi:MAG: hypothetical protein N3B11_03525 [Coriobacteriia bacterium]|nr:hypothetical protein [Coriobacteriia bacterium]